MLDVLRLGGQWERLVELEPADEPAYRELMRAAMSSGNRHAAVQWYGRLRTALLRDVGVLPDRETDALYDACVAGLGPVEPPFVGRQLELARAAGVLARQHSSSTCSLVLVRGPAGIGKSALCRQLEVAANRAGWLPIVTRATTGSSPYAPVAAMVDQLLVRDRLLLDKVGTRAREIVTELSSPAPRDEATTMALTRHQVIGALRRVLDAVNQGTRFALFVDDADVADDATIDVLTQLAPSAGAATMVVFAYRTERSPRALDRACTSLTRAGLVLQLDLEALPEDDATALVIAAAKERPEPEAVEAIVRLAGGNPLFLVELARRIDTGEPPSLGPGDAALVRFVDLAEPHASMLARLALVGADLDPAEVAALTACSEQDAFALLDAALAAGVIVVSDGRYRFRHELVRQALAERLPPHQRVAVHRDAARRLERAGAAPALIARHWLEGQRPDAAVDWLLTAARRAVRLGAFVDALDQLEPVLNHVPGHPDALCLRAEALDALGRGGAPGAYAAAAAVAGEGAADDIRAKQALAQLKLGDFAGALGTAEGVEPATLEGRLARALTLSGIAAVGLADPDLASIHAAESRTLALELGDPAAVVAASWANALAAHAPRAAARESVVRRARHVHDARARGRGLRRPAVCDPAPALRGRPVFRGDRVR